MLDAVTRPGSTARRAFPICGLISEYNATEPPRRPNMHGPSWSIARRSAAFIVSDHADRSGEFLREAAGWVQAGRLRYREDIVEGLENAPRAFIGLLRGRTLASG